jgi:hypothetical protein
VTATADASAACRFVLERVRAACAHRWLEGLRQPALPCYSTIPEVRFVAERRVRGLPDPAAQALCGWADGRRRAVLLRGVPSARAVLAWSARGWRCVSLLDGEEGLAFALHDLCHLEKYFDDEHHLGQVGFFAALEAALRDPRFAALEEGFDEEWARERDRVLADMNASPLFLYCGLRCRVAQACRRSGRAGAERLALLLDVLQLEGQMRAIAVLVSSRRAPREASLALAGHFAERGARALAIERQ